MRTLSKIRDSKSGVCFQFLGSQYATFSPCSTNEGQAFAVFQVLYRQYTTLKTAGRDEIRFMHKHLFGWENWWTVAARGFKIWRSLWNRLTLPVKRISYFLNFMLSIQCIFGLLAYVNISLFHFFLKKHLTIGNWTIFCIYSNSYRKHSKKKMQID